jgi:hypothetical protein
LLNGRKADWRPPDKELSEIPSAQRRPPSKPLADYAMEYPDRDAAITATYASGGYSMKEVGERIFRLALFADQSHCQRMGSSIK